MSHTAPSGFFQREIVNKDNNTIVLLDLFCSFFPCGPDLWLQQFQPKLMADNVRNIVTNTHPHYFEKLNKIKEHFLKHFEREWLMHD